RVRLSSLLATQKVGVRSSFGRIAGSVPTIFTLLVRCPFQICSSLVLSFGQILVG
ncbi:unnamed protein product, partial [Citrullus colocynthis]